MTDLSFHGVFTEETVAHIFSRYICDDMIRMEFTRVYDLYVPSLGLAVNRRNGSLEAFLSDGSVYDSSRKWLGDYGPVLHDSLYLGSAALLMFTQLKESLESVKQSQLRVAGLFR